MAPVPTLVPLPPQRTAPVSLNTSPFWLGSHREAAYPLFLPAVVERHAVLVERASAIDWSEFEGISTLGVTAGASAPEALVDEVIEAFAERFDISVSAQGAGRETIVFNLPRELRPASPAA